MGVSNHFGGRQLLRVAWKSLNNATCTSFSTVNLLAKDLRFKQGGAKLASCPGRHLTLLRPWELVSFR